MAPGEVQNQDFYQSLSGPDIPGVKSAFRWEEAIKGFEGQKLRCKLREKSPPTKACFDQQDVMISAITE